MVINSFHDLSISQKHYGMSFRVTILSTQSSVNGNINDTFFFIRVNISLSGTSRQMQICCCIIFIARQKMWLARIADRKSRTEPFTGPRPSDRSRRHRYGQRNGACCPDVDTRMLRSSCERWLQGSRSPFAPARFRIASSV